MTYGSRKYEATGAMQRAVPLSTLIKNRYYYE
jgi:hypothetical protein